MKSSLFIYFSFLFYDVWREIGAKQQPWFVPLGCSPVYAPSPTPLSLFWQPFFPILCLKVFVAPRGAFGPPARYFCLDRCTVLLFHVFERNFFCCTTRCQPVFCSQKVPFFCALLALRPALPCFFGLFFGRFLPPFQPFSLRSPLFFTSRSLLQPVFVCTFILLRTYIFIFLPFYTFILLYICAFIHPHFPLFISLNIQLNA